MQHIVDQPETEWCYYEYLSDRMRWMFHLYLDVERDRRSQQTAEAAAPAEYDAAYELATDSLRLETAISVARTVFDKYYDVSWSPDIRVVQADATRTERWSQHLLVC